MLLVWFICEYNKRTPWYFTLIGPPVGKELLECIHNDFRFIWKIYRFISAYWFQVTGVNTKFTPYNCLTGALFAKEVPIFLNNLDNIIPSWFINILADLHIFLQFGRITIIDKFHHVIPLGIFSGYIWEKKKCPKDA